MVLTDADCMRRTGVLAAEELAGAAREGHLPDGRRARRLSGRPGRPGGGRAHLQARALQRLRRHPAQHVPPGLHRRRLAFLSTVWWLPQRVVPTWHKMRPYVLSLPNPLTFEATERISMGNELATLSTPIFFALC